MIRKYLYAGAILLVIAVVVLYSVSSYITAGTPTSILNTTVPRHGVADVPVLVNSSAVSIIFVFADNLTNIYFMNQSAFGGLSAYLSGNSSKSAYSYVSAHSLNSSDVFLNASSGIKEVYQTSPGGTPQTSNYYVYAVIDSTGGSPSYNGSRQRQRGLQVLQLRLLDRTLRRGAGRHSAPHRRGGTADLRGDKEAEGHRYGRA